jgi:transmembrane sensor
MTKLQAPLRDQLAARVDETAVQRIWTRVRARRGGSLLVRRRGLPAWSYGVGIATVTALAVALLIGGIIKYNGSKAPPSQAAPGPLVARAGTSLSTLGGERDSEDQLSDGSSIQLEAGSRLEVLENTSKTFVSVLRRGRGTFAVQPGGPRRWTIEAGLATVEVVGTRFTVARGEASVEVEVQHGVVLVRSDLIADRVQRLSAGQRLSVRLPAVPTDLRTEIPDQVPGPVSSATAAPLRSASAASLDEQLGLANEQRRRGDLSGAELSLRRALSEHPTGPQAALIAFTLGKLLQDAAGRPADAAAAFERCLASSPPSALAEDALFRAAEAHAAAGHVQAASSSARKYRERYPGGRHASDVMRWIVDP